MQFKFPTDPRQCSNSPLPRCNAQSNARATNGREDVEAKI